MSCCQCNLSTLLRRIRPRRLLRCSLGAAAAQPLIAAQGQKRLFDRIPTALFWPFEWVGRTLRLGCRRLAQQSPGQ